MKNLSLILVAGILLLTIAGTSWFLLSESNTAELGSAHEEAAADPGSEPAQVNGAEEELAGDSALSIDEEREVVSEPLAADRVRVSGHVRKPFGASKDGALEAFALADEYEYDEFREALIEQTEEQLAELLLDRAVVKADGSFSLTFPRKLTQGHVIVAGKFLYALESTAVNLAEPEELIINPEIGCFIDGQLSAADASQATDALAAVRLIIDIDRLALDSKPDGRNTLSCELETDANGRFELHALPVEYTYTFQVIPDQFAAQSVSIAELTAGEERVLEISLGLGGQIAGRVMSPAGEPIENATVHAALVGSTFGFDDEGIGSAITDSAGLFVLEAMPAGSVGIKADHVDYLNSKRVDVQVVVSETTDGLEIQLSEGRQLTGLVNWPDGTPVKDAQIRVRFDRAFLSGPSAFNALRGAEGETTTGDDGRFVVNGMGNGPFIVTAEARPLDLEPTPEGEEEDHASWFHARVESVQAGSDLELVLHGPLNLNGRVLDDQENALANFTVRGLRQAKGGFGELAMEERDESFEDTDGSFSLVGLTEGAWEIEIQGEGFITTEARRVIIPIDETLVFSLVRSASISGRVLTPGGTPIANATVTLDAAQATFQSAISQIDHRPKVTSDESGAFELNNLAPGSTAILAEHDDYCASDPLAFDLVPGVRLDEAELRLRKGGRLTGLVYAKSGEFAAGYLLVLNSPTMEQVFSNTNSEGEFEVNNVPPGHWQIVAMNSGSDYSADSDGSNSGLMGALLMSQAEIMDGETTHVIIGAPPADPVKITGQVTHGGEPFTGAILTFFQAGTKLYENMKFASFEEDGRYSVVVDGPGEYVVFLQKMGRTQFQQQNVEFSVEVPQVSEYEHDFTVPTGRISGTVTDANGSPAVDARVTLSTDGGFRSDVLMGGQYSEILTDAAGHFDLVGLRPGTYMVAAGGAMLLELGGKSGTSVGRVTRGGIHLREGEWKKDFDFTLEAPGSVEVSVIGMSGEPLDGAGVFLRDSDGRSLEPLNLATTNATGRCLMRGIAPGDYTVMSRVGLACSQESAPFRVAASETKKLELRLETGTVLWIKLKDSDGEDARASISVIDRTTGHDWAAFFGMDDLEVLYLDGGFSPTEHRIGPLPPGKYKIQARGDAGSKNKPVTLRGEPERKLTLRLK